LSDSGAAATPPFRLGGLRAGHCRRSPAPAGQPVPAVTHPEDLRARRAGRGRPPRAGHPLTGEDHPQGRSLRSRAPHCADPGGQQVLTLTIAPGSLDLLSDPGTVNRGLTVANQGVRCTAANGLILATNRRSMPQDTAGQQAFWASSGHARRSLRIGTGSGATRRLIAAMTEFADRPHESRSLFQMKCSERHQLCTSRETRPQAVSID